jgi:hypothetical protein
VNDDLGKLKDKDSKPTDKYCWIKADPTFEGLRQIINEPEDRVFIGALPPKMEEVRRNTTRYLSQINIRPLITRGPEISKSKSRRPEPVEQHRAGRNHPSPRQLLRHPRAKG